VENPLHNSAEGVYVENLAHVEHYEIRNLVVHQMRKIGQHLGLPLSLLTRRDQCFITLMKRFKSNPNSVKESMTKNEASRKVTLDAKSVASNRLVSTLFGPQFRDDYSKLNNSKNHKDFEIVFGRNNKIFWNDVVDCVNCSEEGSQDASRVVMGAPADYLFADKYAEYVDEAIAEHPVLDLSVQLTVTDALEVMSLLLKCRAWIEKSMHSKTGVNEPDAMKFTAGAQVKNMCVRKVSHFTIYYFYMQCIFFPQVGKMFTTALPMDLKGEGNTNASNSKPSAKGARSEDVAKITQSFAENADKLVSNSQRQHEDRMAQQDERQRANQIQNKETLVIQLTNQKSKLEDKIDRKTGKAKYDRQVLRYNGELTTLVGRITSLEMEIEQLKVPPKTPHHFKKRARESLSTLDSPVGPFAGRGGESDVESDNETSTSSGVRDARGAIAKAMGVRKEGGGDSLSDEDEIEDSLDSN
jgi:hypothetical protein